MGELFLGNTRTRVTKMLCHTSNPEEKRKIIGDIFVKISDEIIADLKLKPEEVLLGQGTLRYFTSISSAIAFLTKLICFSQARFNRVSIVFSLR